MNKDETQQYGGIKLRIETEVGENVNVDPEKWTKKETEETDRY